MDQSDITLFAQTNFRSARTKFGIKTNDRRRHFYIIGKTGSGKTTLMENMVIEDILAHRGVGVVDPHGDFAERILKFVPEDRLEDVVYFNPADTENPVGFNPLERVKDEHYHVIASSIMGVFKKIWPDVWSARMEYILNNSLLSLLEYPGSTLLGIMRLLAEKDYRDEVVSHLTDPVVKGFWVNEFARYTQRLESEATAAIQNKVGQFVSNPLIRRIIGQPHSTIDVRKIMDEGKILIVNLSKGRIGEDNSALLGAMMITKMQLAAMSRVDIPENERKDFYLYIDEFQNFSTESFAGILSEARKYRLNLILAHQYIEQLDEVVRAAIFGNVGTILCFRIGSTDAEVLEKEFLPEFNATDLVNLSQYHMYIKLMIDGIASHPFSAESLPPRALPETFYDADIIENNKRRYGTPKEIVDQKIRAEWEADREIIEEKSERRTEQSLDVLTREYLRPKPPKPTKREIDTDELHRLLAGSAPKEEFNSPVEKEVKDEGVPPEENQ